MVRSGAAACGDNADVDTDDDSTPPSTTTNEAEVVAAEAGFTISISLLGSSEETVTLLAPGLVGPLLVVVVAVLGGANF